MSIESDQRFTIEVLKGELEATLQTIRFWKDRSEHNLRESLRLVETIKILNGEDHEG